MRIINYYPAIRQSYPGFGSEFGRLFESVFDAPGSFRDRQFPVEFNEDKDKAYLRAELPGVNRDDIGVEILDGTLTIQASRKPSLGNEGEPVKVARSVSLPEDVQADKVTAVYENGVLTVTLPKQEQAKPQKITVAVK